MNEAGGEGCVKLTLKLPKTLHIELLQHCIRKHKSVHGHKNDEIVLAVQRHLEREDEKTQTS